MESQSESSNAANPYETPTLLSENSSEFLADLDLLKHAKARLDLPAIALAVLASIQTLWDLGLAISAAIYPVAFGPQTPFAERVLPLIVIAGVHLFQALSAVKMRHLKSIKRARLAAIIAIFPLFSPLIVLGIPFGIWIFLLLRKPEMKEAFQVAKRISAK